MGLSSLIVALRALGGVTATETTIGDEIYEVFWLRTTPKRGLFRVRIGRKVGSEAIKWWGDGVSALADVRTFLTAAA